MQSFKQFISESEIKKLPWDSSPTIGWWKDKKILRMYHGTNLDHIDSFNKEGLNRPDPRTKLYSLAFEPFTARAFAVMGGEAHFLASKSKSLVVPEFKRAVIIFDIPQKWIQDNLDTYLGGNDDTHKERLTDKQIYDDWVNSDQQYYQLCELRVTVPVPAKFIAGYTLK